MALAEDPSSVSSTHVKCLTTTCNLAPKKSVALFHLLWALYTCGTHHTNTQINKQSKLVYLVSLFTVLEAEFQDWALV